MLSLATVRKAVIIRVVMALCGAVILLLSTSFPEHFLGLPLQEVARELATFVLASLLVHWIYETHLREEVQQDVVSGNTVIDNVDSAAVSEVAHACDEIFARMEDDVVCTGEPRGICLGFAACCTDNGTNLGEAAYGLILLHMGMLDMWRG